jgi:hypothetical protein
MIAMIAIILTLEYDIPNASQYVYYYGSSF